MTEIDTDSLHTPPMRLDGQTAVVTGAGRGLGRACSLALAEAGAKVVLVSRTEEELKRVCREITASGGDAEILVCDVTDSKQINSRIGGLERIDILVNNAGDNFPEPFVDVTEEHLDQILNLNVRATFLVSQVVTRKMLEQGEGGSIINMSSQMGHVGAPNRTVYCATKHAVEGLTKAMGVELGPHGIRVNSIAPTFIETPKTRPYFENKVFSEQVNSYISLGRVGRYEDIMGPVVFLASPAAALITGTSIKVDGGWTAH